MMPFVQAPDPASGDNDAGIQKVVETASERLSTPGEATVNRVLDLLTDVFCNCLAAFFLVERKNCLAALRRDNLLSISAGLVCCLK
jgi:hypothetical protein